MIEPEIESVPRIDREVFVDFQDNIYFEEGGLIVLLVARLVNG